MKYTQAEWLTDTDTSLSV
uniref:Uncharacterized protein n=1 Tax=Anguilla anguilla TaxID=7936 RepID=A0A0E9XI74_ANGAN